jgi:UDP-glucuronate decarboxylase
MDADLREITALDLPWEELEGGTVVITGAGGFLASYLVETLLYLNDTRFSRKTSVLGLVRNKRKAEERFSHHARRSDFELIEHDVRNACDFLTSAEYIIHAASPATPKHFAIDPVGTITANIFGAHSMLVAGSRLQTRRLLYVSSGEVYGQPPPEMIPTAENQYGYINILDVRACYAEGKRASESLCVSWSKQNGLSTTIVRPFHTYGPGMCLNDGRVFADFVRDVVENRPICIRGDGRARRAFCYVADVAQGIFVTLLLGDTAQAYNIGNDTGECSVEELAILLKTLFPERSPRIEFEIQDRSSPYLLNPITRTCPDITLAKKLGWTPKTSLEVGFTKTVRSFL